MKLENIQSAVVWVDFFTIVASKVFHSGKSLDKWYANFGFVAVLSDCLVIVLGILLAQMILPNASLMTLLGLVILIQIIHDYLFYVFVIRQVPRGQNSMIDLFKEYASENSWKILVADSIMIGSTVLLGDYLSHIRQSYNAFVGLLGVYALTYIIYTK